MSDLISRDEVLKIIEETRKDKLKSNFVSLEKKINRIPTAFDLDKVIAELEREKDSFHGGIYEGTAEEFYFQKGIDMAIDIIKKHLSSTAEPPKTD